MNLVTSTVAPFPAPLAWVRGYSPPPPTSKMGGGLEERVWDSRLVWLTTLSVASATQVAFKVTRIHTGPGSNTIIGYSPQEHKKKNQCLKINYHSRLCLRSGCPEILNIGLAPTFSMHSNAFLPSQQLSRDQSSPTHAAV